MTSKLSRVLRFLDFLLLLASIPGAIWSGCVVFLAWWHGADLSLAGPIGFIIAACCFAAALEWFEMLLGRQ